MNRGVGRAAEQPLKPPIGTPACCGSKVAPGATEQLEGPFYSAYPGVNSVCFGGALFGWKSSGQTGSMNIWNDGPSPLRV